MKKIFLVEQKSFFKDSLGIEYQVADWGLLPDVYTSFKRAVEAMARLQELKQSLYGDRVVAVWKGEDLGDSRIMDRFETMSDKTGLRSVVTLYSDYTI